MSVDQKSYTMICEICKKEFETEAPLESVLISSDGIESACDDCVEGKPKY